MDAVDRLLTFGLTRTEARIYAALLRVQTAKVSELVDLVKMHRPNVYAALNRLQERGLVSGSEGKVGVFTASPPDLAFAGTLTETKSLLHAQKESIKQMKRVYECRANRERPLPFIEVKRAAPNEPDAGLADRIRCIDGAKKEILFLSAGYGTLLPPSVPKSAQQLLIRAEIAALKRGVRCRCVIPADSLRDHRARLREWAALKAGEEARVVDSLPTSVNVVDRQAVWFKPNNIQEKGVCYKINDPAIGELFAGAFEYYWQQGVNATEYINRLNHGRGRRARAVVK